MTPEISTSLFALLCCVCLGMFCYKRHTREHNELEPRMIPWIIIAIGCLAVSFMIIVHIVNLLGFETGNR
ncbi:MAG: hypothetical protein COA43_02210 [Robiginitomaculum sp.]|nr:MAG: hypothetical protein COA43_02210 [Robiginitomaculum sp.]